MSDGLIVVLIGLVCVTSMGIAAYWMTRMTLRVARNEPHGCMCIRCDEIRPDVPFEGARCPPCQAIVDEIAIKHPDVYADYLRRTQRFKGYTE